MTTVRLLKNGVEAFPAMFDAIDRAQSCVVLEMYILADDGTGREFRDRLVNAAKRGAEVMVLIDAWGAWQLQDSFWNDLRAAGGKVRWFHPISRGLLPFRNHRKMLLVDDRIVYVGGMNIADEYYRGTGGQAPWRDNMLEISGTEAARLRRSFLRMWRRAEIPLRRLFLKLRGDRAMRSIKAGKVLFLESGPADPIRPVRKIYRLVIQNAVESIDLAMGYFYPQGQMMRALKRAVTRGVRVRLLFPEKTDVPIARWAAHGLYGRMLRAGVEVWEYRPAMMHAKLAIADDTVIAGSANLDIRSGMINYELVAVVQDEDLARQARSDFEQDLAHSVRIRLEEWRKRPLIQIVKERISFYLLARFDILFSRSRFARHMR
jgi:cardiolipin synthase